MKDFIKFDFNPVLLEVKLENFSVYTICSE